MVNTSAQFMAAVNAASGEGRDKTYWDNLRKLGPALEKLSSGDLDKLFENIHGRIPFEAGPLVYVLCGKVKRLPTDHASANRFVAQFNTTAAHIVTDEMDFIHDKFTSAFAQFSKFLLDNTLSIHGLVTMRKAINALSRGETGILTNLHAIFFRLCLDSKRLDPAMPYLSLDASNCFLNVQQIYRVSCENALLFFHYGGLIKVAMKDFLGAALMFESCVCMPAFAASAIMLESLKKLILLNLILGRPQQLPGYRAPPVQRLSQTKCQKYQTVVQLYNDITENKNNNRGATVSRLRQQLERVSGELEKDRNMGLAEELYISAAHNNIAKLPDVFSKLQIAKVAKYCRLDDEHFCVQHELETFLQKDHIEGKIDAREGTVSFQPAQRSVEVDQQKLYEATNACSVLDELLVRSERVVDLHPAILARQLKKQQNATGSGFPMQPPGISLSFT